MDEIIINLAPNCTIKITDDELIFHLMLGGYMGEVLMEMPIACLDKIALVSPLVIKMIEYIKCDYINYFNGYERDAIKNKLLNEIAELQELIIPAPKEEHDNSINIKCE